MNIRTIQSEDNSKFSDIINSIKTILFINHEYQNYKITFDNSKLDYDLYLVFSNNSNEIIKYCENIRSKSKIIIITDNLCSEHIRTCINYTSNLIYANTKVDNMVFKIISIYENNKYLNSIN